MQTEDGFQSFAVVGTRAPALSFGVASFIFVIISGVRHSLRVLNDLVTKKHYQELVDGAVERMHPWQTPSKPPAA